jgi:hypothetical protein
VGSVLFFAMTGLVLLPFALAVVAVVTGALSADLSTRTPLVSGGALCLVLWSLTVAVSQSARFIPSSGEVSGRVELLLYAVAYAPYLILAVILLVAPYRLGLAVFRRLVPSQVPVLERAGSTGIWVTGMRTLGTLSLLVVACALLYFAQPLAG